MDSQIVDNLNIIEQKYGNCHFIDKKSRENSIYLNSNIKIIKEKFNYEDDKC